MSVLQCVRCVCIMVLLVAIGPQRALASTGVEILVNSSDDDGIDANPGNGVCETIPGNNKCTLRAAVMEANGAPGPDTIRLQAGTLYVLTRPNALGPDDDLVGASGDLDLVNDDITIHGNGATVDGNATERVFQVAGNITAVIRDLTIRNGSDINGGGIFGVGNLTLDNCTVTNNVASNHGGGIYSRAGSRLTLNGCLVSFNEVSTGTSMGAGIYNLGTLDATGSTITRNVATANGLSNGGGLANEGGTATFTDCTLSYNECSSQGGGIWNTAALTLRRTRVQNNATRSSIVGGAITTDGYEPAGVSVTIEDSTISGNTPGGIRQYGATMLVRRSDIASNPGGNGIGIEGTAVVTLERTTVRGHARSGIHNTSRLILTDGCVIRDNVAEGSTLGGGIHNVGRNAILNISDSLILHNTYSNASATGGGVSNVSGGQLTIIDSEVAENTTGLYGGGVQNDWQSTAAIRGCLFRDNSGPSRGGGVNNDKTMTIEASTFVGNSAGQANQGNTGGGAIFNSNHGTISLTNVTLSGNAALRDGGGLHNQGTCTILATTFAGNTASNQGDAIYQNPSIVAPFTFANTIISAATIGRACANAGVFVSNGHNIASDATCGLLHATDLASTDPLLGPLGDHGGLTTTHRLRFGSPAIDGGDDAACTSQDQRGLVRPADGDDDGVIQCDVGAYEQQFADCNENLTFDLTDISVGTSFDDNDNGRPDECEPPGDVNGDGVVNLGDYDRFQLCLTGSNQPPPLGCGGADLNVDGVVDLLDFQEIQLQLTPN